MEEEQLLGISDYLAILKRRKKQLILPALVILLLSIGLAIGLPSVYRSEATILIEQQEIPSELVRSTVTSYAGERIQIISQRVMTSDNLGKIIDAYGLFRDEREESSISQLVETMREDIELEMISADVVDPRSGRPTSATIAFKLSFNNNDPRIAQKVTNELASLYLSENLKQREKSAVETSDFLASEADKLNSLVKDQEAELAQFKEQYFNNLPELQELNIQLMERSERELTDNTQQIRSLEERVIYLKSELAQMSPSSISYSSDGKRIYSAADRLKELQTEYVSLTTRYTGDHPTVKKLKEEIKALSQEVSTVGKDGSSNNILSSRADNPAYVQLQTQLKAAETELQSLVMNKSEINAKIKDYEDRLMQSPQVEREYRKLTRDYENALAKYQEIKAKQLEAELSKSLERERKGERFSLIEPPLVPESPDKPNRIAILLLGFMVSLVGGVGNVVLFESMDDTVHGIKGITDITKVPPLAEIPYIKNSQEITRQVVNKRLILAAAGVVSIVCVVLVHFLIMPLDVLMYMLLRVVGVDG
jgi:polysaccharide chain length determinant protein (PEP-CTERM system associated)